MILHLKWNILTLTSSLVIGNFIEQETSGPAKYALTFYVHQDSISMSSKAIYEITREKQKVIIFFERKKLNIHNRA
jgi:hypothetical protein